MAALFIRPRWWHRCTVQLRGQLCGLLLALAAPGLWALPTLAVASGATSSMVDAASTQDDRGQPIVQGPPPQRIVSLQPALTEALCALDECQRLVGVDRYASWPAAVIGRLPVVGGGVDPQLERIVALRPDVVLLTRAAPIAQRLQDVGIRTLVMDANNLAQIEQVLQRLALLVGRPEAGSALWQRMQADVAQAAANVPAAVQGVRVYVEVSRGPYAAGRSSYIGEILERMGVHNIVPPEMGPFPLLSPEFIVRAQPDVILQAESQPQPYPGWALLEAVRQGHICRFATEDINILLRPGPRMGEAAQLIAQCLREKAPRHAQP